MKNYLFGPNGLATKIVHTRYLSRWIVMGIDVVLSTLVTVFAYPVCQGRTCCLVMGCIFGIIGGGH